ncbi:MAG: glycosyltransferase [Thermoleophilia bacterium]|nr:glycosyltransferase [Thermoleophilia bacterium]
MLQEVHVGHKSLADYQSVVVPPLIDEIREIARELEGARVLHINATSFGGGVAEILYTLVPLMRDVGLETDWRVIMAAQEYYESTKVIHNALQGNPIGLTDAQKETYELHNKIAAESLGGGFDFIIIHDPQPVMIRHFAGDLGAKWIWRCHIDTSTPNQTVAEYLTPYISGYDTALFTLNDYVFQDLDMPIRVISPAIDPLSTKNMALSPEDADYVVSQFGIEPDRPLMLQISRFDPWKDPLGVIDAYRIVKEKYASVRLALVGSMATDDPEGWTFFTKTVEHAGDDSDILILTNLNNVGNLEVNAFQSRADLIIQKSIREGFGLTISEALWKAKPTVGGNVGGIPSQLEDGLTGFLVSSPEECAKRCIKILEDPPGAKVMGRRGKEHVRAHYLTPRLLRDYLKMFIELKGAG